MLKRRTPNKLWPGRKIDWTPKMIKYLQDNYSKKNNWELAAHLHLGITAVRMKLYSLGLKRMEMEYWTNVQINFLINNYRKIGDVEMAEIFEKKFPKNKKWTLKHIEKKRKYLNLNRTEKEVHAVFLRNKRKGRFKFCPVNRWIQMGVFPEGTVRIWKNNNGIGRFKAIKINGAFVHYAHWLYMQHHGKFKPGHVIGFKDRNNMNVIIENLESITRAEHARRNGRNASSRYPEELRETITALRTLNKLIKNAEDQGK